MSYRFTKEAVTALDNYIAGGSKDGNDVRELESNKTNTLISVLLYENDGSLGFYIRKSDGKVVVRYNDIEDDSDWKYTDEMVELLQAYVETIPNKENA